MSFNQRLDATLAQTSSRLVVGLDPDPHKLPAGIRPDRPGLVRFLTAVVDETAEHCVAFKPNAAFFEALGEPGMAALDDVGDHVRSATDRLFILDAKRGDVGHTAERYAHAVFALHKADAVTVSPYLGQDAVTPFAEQEDKGVFVLARTTNPSAAAVQEVATTRDPENKKDPSIPFYLHIAKLVRQWDKNDNLGLVAGATAPGPLEKLRKTIGDTVPLLIPGVGAQGGALQKAVRAASDQNGRGFLVSASRSILYAGSGDDWAKQAGKAAAVLADAIATALAAPNA